MKNVYTERKTTEQFNRIGSEIIPILEEKLGTDVFLTKSYHNKETHGDMDLLIKVDTEFNNKQIKLTEILEELFKPGQIHSNGSVVSFDYDSFQIDLIPIKMSVWEVSKVYFSYDPIGNLLGKIAHQFGLKYGVNGLTYPFRSFSGRLTKDIVISRDINKIFEFLGYDYNVYEKGFNTLEDIFIFVIEGKYFDPEKYHLNNLRAKDRQRNKKRKTYNEFISYINDNKITKKYDFKKWSEYINIIDEKFPDVGFVEKLKKLEVEDKQNKLIKEKFNGRVIMERYPELKDSKLGDILGDFRNSFGDFRSFIINSDVDDILISFDNFYENKKGAK